MPGIGSIPSSTPGNALWLKTKFQTDPGQRTKKNENGAMTNKGQLTTTSHQPEQNGIFQRGGTKTINFY